MIGVAVQPCERDVVREFFELYKTPWEFYRRGQRYDVVFSTAEPFDAEAQRLHLLFSGAATSCDSERGMEVRLQSGGFLRSQDGKRLPVYGALATFPADQSGFLREEATQHAAATLSHSRGVITLRLGYNLFAEARHLLTRGQPAANAGFAALELHIAWLRDWITRAGIPSVEIPPVPDGHRWIACLTHDIDHPSLRNHGWDHTTLGFLYRSTIGTLVNVCRGRKPAKCLWRNLAAACRLPLVHCGLSKDIWMEFDRYLELEAGSGSTFFVIPRGGYPGRTAEGFGPAMRACHYEADALLPQLRRIASAGSEVGVHGLDAWMDAEQACREREKISRATGKNATGVRMHWLYFDENSPAALERAGFSYDSTVGYNETVGYRAGTLQAYRPLGASHLLELPLHIMDTALFSSGTLNLSEAEAEELVRNFSNDAERFGGALTINWHDRSIAAERLWGDFYCKLLNGWKRQGAWLAPASQAAAWFGKRRMVSFVQENPGRIKVRCPAAEPDGLPGLKLRIHAAQTKNFAGMAPIKITPDFEDIPLSNASELSIAI